MLGNVKLKLRKLPETNEYQVAWYEDGKYNEDKTYYTDDLEDAILTSKAISEEALEHGYPEVEVVMYPRGGR